MTHPKQLRNVSFNSLQFRYRVLYSIFWASWVIYNTRVRICVGGASLNHFNLYFQWNKNQTKHTKESVVSREHRWGCRTVCDVDVRIGWGTVQQGVYVRIVLVCGVLFANRHHTISYQRCKETPASFAWTVFAIRWALSPIQTSVLAHLICLGFMGGESIPPVCFCVRIVNADLGRLIWTCVFIFNASHAHTTTKECQSIYMSLLYFIQYSRCA